MTDKVNNDNKFTKQQPLRHSLASVTLNGDHLKINKQLYQILVNKQEAINLDVLRKKYDPYLDQYDFLVGDVSSDHLRLRGFYKDNVQTAIDRKQRAIADYLMEFCNPGGPYFVLQLLTPVHHYKTDSRKNWGSTKKHRQSARLRKDNNLSYRHHQPMVHFKKRETGKMSKEVGIHHSFIIKKRKSSN
ncbi:MULTISPECIES: YutD family protein [unclassified Lactobacillus]|uniref:YutD family protein n=1 Tax=unclassified Lactobacillus TaxID=2620435 RepID=UPI000EFAC3E4|nr:MULTISPECIES: YutD family protein [unclassified Lactobacillus]RMC25544.1 DUF1027 domain-containing protein [Lactobacillus sp. ESL0247]RMC29448.1 DUF1027 domain-containing protein [Lactobacillus sp. ESL0246]RMC33177.1 DUF1027 domain-containing protein [Lactobacillus sp. ESL0245]